MKKIGEVSSLFGWRASPALIDEDSKVCGTWLVLCRHYYQAPRGRLTTRYHDYIIGDKSDESQHAPSPIEMGNPNSYSLKEELNYGKTGYHYA